MSQKRLTEREFFSLVVFVYLSEYKPINDYYAYAIQLLLKNECIARGYESVEQAYHYAPALFEESK